MYRVKKFISSLLVLGVLFSFTPGDSSDASAKKNPPTCSLKEFKSIKTGMTVKKVRSIIGSKGKLVSSASAGEYKSTMYEFKGNTSYSSVLIQFNNGKVFAKSQAGLK